MMDPDRIITLFFTVLISLLAVGGVEYGEGCHRSDAGFNQCVVDQMNSQQAKIKKGLPHLKIGPLDPLFIPQIILKQGSGPVSIEMTSTNQIFRGISNYKINRANVDMQNYKMEFTAYLPWLFVEGNTRMEGRVLILPIKGSGDSWSNYTTVGAKALLSGHATKRGGKEHFSLDDIKFEMTVKQATLHLNNLFNGNQELGDAMNKLMADNWEVVYEELKPVIEQTAAALVKDMAVKVLDHYSVDDLFPK